MAHHKSAKKRIIRNEKKRVENKGYISMIKTFIKKVEVLVRTGKKAEAKEPAKKAESLIAKGASKGRMHKNKAARKISRLNKKVASK